MIVDKIKKMKRWNMSTEKNCIEIVNKMTKEDTSKIKFQHYLTHLQPFLQTSDFYHKSEDPYFNLVAFISLIEEDKYIHFPKDERLEFDYPAAVFDYLIEAIEEKSKTWMWHDFSHTNSYTPVGLLKKIIHEGSLLIDGTTEYTQEFWNIEIIQRIFVNIDLEDSLSEKLVKKLNTCINFQNKHFGSELNAYIEKHKIPGDIQYIEMIGPYTSGVVNMLPFISVVELTDENQVNDLVFALKNQASWQTIPDDKNFLNEKSLSGQNEAFIRVLNTEENWQQNKQWNESFLFKLLSDDQLFSEFLPAISQMIETSVKKDLLSQSIIKIFIRKLEARESNKIDYNTSKAIVALIENYQNEDDPIFHFLFEKVVPSSLNTDSGLKFDSRSNLIDINNFLNTELGRYYEILEHVDDTVTLKYKKSFIEGINQLDESWKDYVIGRNLFLFDKNQNLVPSKNMFIGFCYRWRIREQKTMDYFLETVISLLEDNNFSDEGCISNILAILIRTLNPQDNPITLTTNVAYKIKICHSLVTLYLKNSNHNLATNMENWIAFFFRDELFVKNEASYLLNVKDKAQEPMKKLIAILEQSAISAKEKINEYEFSHFYQLEKYENWQYECLIDLIRIYLKENYVTVNSGFVNGMREILKTLRERNLSQESKLLFNTLDRFLLPKDVDYLKKQF